MVTLFDIVRQAQGGSALDNLSRQFGLNPDQTRHVVEAFLPAFTLGLQRAAANPFAFSQLLDMMSSGRYAPYFDGGFGAPRSSEGQQVLERLFGSPEVTRQIAAQTSAMTGVGAQVAHQMMASVASIVMGGLFKSATVEGLADFLRGWSDWLRTLRPPEPAPSRSAPAFSPFAAWTDLMTAMLGKPAPEKASPPALPEPWSAFLEGLKGSSAPKPPPPPPSQPDPFATLSKMFETGREVQAQHLANLQSIFDGLRDATTRR